MTLANPDTAAPAVSLTGPAPGTLAGQVPLTATATDANGVTWNTDPVAAGQYTLTARAYDAAGNVGAHFFKLRVTDNHGAFDKATVDVTVEDTSGPVLTLPADLTVAATSAAGAIATFSASALDAIDGPVEVVCTPASGSPFPFETTRVTCTATDLSENTASGAFTVTVRDLTAPVLSLPASLTLEATSSAGSVATFSASAVDEIDGPVGVVCMPLSGSTFPIGTTTVSCSATDAAGNTASGSFTVTVDDVTQPAPTGLRIRP